MNKKAFLLAEETLKMVIALISISFLIYFLSALYFTNQNSKDLELAEATLENLIESANSGIEEVEIYNPEGWVLISWPYQDKDKTPLSCSKLNWESCICIIKDINLGSQLLSLLPFTEDVRDKFLDESSNTEKAICVENTKNLVVKKDGTQQQPIAIQPPLTLNIKDKIIKLK